MRKRKPPVTHAGRHTLMQKADTRRLSVALGSLSEVGVHQINIAVETEDQNTFRFYLGFFFLMAWKELYCTLLKDCTSTETENANGEVTHSSKFKN